MTEYKNMLGGTPQKLVSKFRISYNLVLNLLKNGETTNFVSFASKSMMFDELQNEIESSRIRVEDLTDKLKKKKEFIEELKTPAEMCRKYLQTEIVVRTSGNKKKKDAEKELQNLRDNHKYILGDIKSVKNYDDMQKQLIDAHEHKLYLETYIQEQIRRVCYVLLNEGFVNQHIQENEPEPAYELTTLGKISANIAEIHPLVFSKLLINTRYFVDVKVSPDHKINVPRSKDQGLQMLIEKMNNMYLHIESIEQESQIHTGIKYEDALNFDMTDDSIEWTECSNEIDCKYFIQNKIADKGISVGDFTKAMLKIATIAKEIGAICEEMQQTDLLYKLTQIDSMILKYITTSQSLYV
jgi:hypothetical protein